MDSGAALSVALESAISALLHSTELESTNVVLCTYTGEPIPVSGVLSVSVKYGRKSYPGLKLIVVRGSGPCLMGQDWLSAIRLDWRNIAKVTAILSSADLSTHVTALQERYHEV